jgi:nucleotide-binding universal stress UspA family protein
MYRTILVPLDGSTFAEHALPLALSLARRSHAELHLVTVSTPLTQAYIEGVFVGSPDMESEAAGRYKTYLNGVTARLRDRIDVPITNEVITGEVAPTMCDLAASGKYDLVVMATHGRSPMGRFWLGSVADELVRHVNLPLLLVRPTEEEPQLEHEPDLSRVVLALDGTELSEQILAPAVALAEVVPGVEVVLVRAIRPVVPDDVEPTMLESNPEPRNLREEVHRLQEEIRSEAAAYLASIAHRLESRGMNVRTHVVVEDKPARAILQEAEGEHAGLIAMETHGRGGLARLFFGSVADTVVRGAHVPVLIHRPVQV